MQKLKSFNNKINNGVSKFLNNLFNKRALLFWFIIITIIALAIRIACFPTTSKDLNTYLLPWCDIIKSNGTKAFLDTYPAHYNYSMAYFYILAFVSKVGSNHTQFTYLIKAFSVLFDFSLAFVIGLISYNVTKRKNTFVYGYSLALLIPSVFLNSSAWGQCDSIFTFFIALCLYLIIKNKNNYAMLSYGLAIGLKFQAIFFLPIILFLVVKNKIKFTSLLLIFVSFIGINLFSVFLGADLYTALIRSYIEQLQSFGNASLNFPNLYVLVNDFFADGGVKQKTSLIVFLCFTLAVVFIIFTYLTRKNFTITNDLLIKLSILFVTVIPYFLPRMHDRYLYIADILFAVLVATNFKKVYLGFLVWYPSLRCYSDYLFEAKIDNQVSVVCIALMVLLGIILVFLDIHKQINTQQPMLPQDNLQEDKPLQEE